MGDHISEKEFRTQESIETSIVGPPLYDSLFRSIGLEEREDPPVEFLEHIP